MGRRGTARKKSEVGDQEGAKLKLVPGSACANCSKDLNKDAKSFQVEEELSRQFCSESCVSSFFSPEIEYFETDYQKNKPKADLSEKQMKQLEPLRWLTLSEPAEVWTKKTLNGDVVFTYIARFRQKSQKKPIWCICMCFLMKGRPSFLLFSIPTRSQALVNHYRAGKKVKLSSIQKLGRSRVRRTDKKSESRIQTEQVGSIETNPDDTKSLSDGLASPWTREETFRALITRNRKPDDIPLEEFPNFFEKIEESLQHPTEAWSFQLSTADGDAEESAQEAGEDEDFAEELEAAMTEAATESGADTETKLFTFIREYENEEFGKHWYIVIARELEEEEQIEILDAFPTNDPDMVDCFRKGEQQAGASKGKNISRLVH